MISCLMVTQNGRELHAANSIHCFSKQSFSEAELLIVHHGDESYDAYLRRCASKYPLAEINVLQVPDGMTLGAMRNITLQESRFEIICLWDDDDLYHPDRLKIQFEYMQEMNADFCFMTDQLHYFEQQDVMFWDDWTGDGAKNSLIQNTIMGQKKYMGSYPELPKCEDSELVFRIFEEGRVIARLSNHAWLYVYVFHGSNVWEVEHHMLISKNRRLDFQALTTKQDVLQEQLKAYDLPGKTLHWRFLHENGHMVF